MITIVTRVLETLRRHPARKLDRPADQPGELDQRSPGWSAEDFAGFREQLTAGRMDRLRRQAGIHGC